jgi:aryl-alcohol dehydrogenase-like predicted oxidoreductase
VPAPQVLREAKAGILTACEASGLDLSHATLRWMLNHSMLGAGDGLISGVGSLAQLRENMAALTAESGPLPAAVLAAFEHGWNKVVSGPPGYPATNWFPVARL